MTTTTGSLAAPLADPDSFVDGPPWALFRELRDGEPVAWTPEPEPHKGFWSLTRHADIVAVSRSWQEFTSSRGVSLEELEDDQLEHRTSLIDTDHARLTGWGDRLVGGSDPEFSEVAPGTPEYDELRLVPFRSPAALEVFEYGRELQVARRAAPTGDLISALVESRVDDEPLSQQDLDNYFLLLALAGQETTRQALTLAMQTLIDNPEVLARLQTEPELLSGPALDELLRWGAPVYHMRRTATEDAMIGEQQVRSGDKIAIWFPAGNRDERAFDNADVLDLDRPSVDLLTFGKGGPHHCMGAFLAKMEYRVTLEELVARIDTARYDGPVERLRSNFVNGVKRMPVAVTLR